MVSDEANTTATNYDIIIVGGGPGGASCAAFLGQKGYRVLLLDAAKFPRDKSCGDGISGKSMSVIKKLGLKPAIEQDLHRKIFGVIFSSPNGTVIDIPIPQKDASDKNYGYDCRRFVYDNILFQHAKQFATTLEQFRVTDLIWEDKQVVGVQGMNMETKQQQEFRSKVVVGADGANSIIAKKTNLEDLDPKHTVIALRAYYENVTDMKERIEIHFIDEVLPGYFWIFPLENNLANVGVGMLREDLVKRNVKLEESMYNAIQNNSLFKERFKDAKKLGDIKGWTLPLGSKHRKCYGNGFVLLGDAAALIDPFSGEGIGNAMVSGDIAADVIDKAFKQDNFTESVLKEYDEKLWAEIGPELKASYYMQQIGKKKFLINYVINKAKKSQKVRDAVSAMLVNEIPRKTLTSPLFYLKLLFA